MAYQYDPLRYRDSVRLLKLYPAHTVNETLHVDLEEHRLNHVPAYEAISYVWGNPLIKSSVRCSEGILSVTQNLAASLTRFRKRDDVRLLWADAVCINQGDVAERNEQVKLMRDIYEHASRVLIWLGSADETVPAAMYLINHIFDTACTHWNQDPNVTVEIDDVDDFVDFLPNATFPPSGSDKWQPVIEFFSREWFERTWIVQEVAVAKEVMAFSGEHEIPWQRIGVAATWVQKQLMKSDFNLYQEFESSNVYKAMILHDESALQEQDFLDLLAQVREFSATDPKDKVFALLGLRPFLMLPLPVQPDYSKSKLDVYASVVATSLKYHGDLSILSFVHHTDSIDQDWPSFVPRWDASPTAANLLGRTDGFGNLASGNIKLDDHGYSLEGRYLTVHGLILGSIAVIGDLMKAGHFGRASAGTDHGHHPVKLFWNNHLDAFRGYRHIDEVSLLVIRLCQTMTAAFDSSYNKTDRTYDDDRSVIDKHLADYAAYLLGFNPRSAALQSISRDLNDEDDYTGNPANFELAASRVCDDRRLFLVDSDHIGLGPNVMRPGDQLCILFGGQQLYVLRAKGKYYQLVGECFVQGWMWGEGLQAYETGQQEMQEFCIC